MKRKRRVMLAAGILVAAGAAAGFRHFGANDAATGLVASGTVEATEARLGFEAAGRIAAVGVQEGERVEPGQAIARLDQAELVARREQAAAQVGAARALLQEMERGSRVEELAQARAGAAAATERLRDAERDLDRTKRLHEDGLVSREAYDKTVLALEVARSAGTQADEQLRLVERGPRIERIAAQRAQLAQSEAALRALDATLANTTLRSPFSGVVSIRHREPGEVVAPGSPVLSVTNRDDRWVRVFIPENRVGAVQTGLPATIRADADRAKAYAGEIVSIASEAEFTPKNVQTTEERVRLVYAVKVRITGDPTYDLKPGLAADVTLLPGTP